MYVKINLRNRVSMCTHIVFPVIWTKTYAHSFSEVSDRIGRKLTWRACVVRTHWYCSSERARFTFVWIPAASGCHSYGDANRVSFARYCFNVKQEEENARRAKKKYHESALPSWISTCQRWKKTKIGKNKPPGFVRYWRIPGTAATVAELGGNEIAQRPARPPDASDRFAAGNWILTGSFAVRGRLSLSPGLSDAPVLRRTR